MRVRVCRPFYSFQVFASDDTFNECMKQVCTDLNVKGFVCVCVFRVSHVCVVCCVLCVYCVVVVVVLVVVLVVVVKLFVCCLLFVCSLTSHVKHTHTHIRTQTNTQPLLLLFVVCCLCVHSQVRSHCWYGFEHLFHIWPNRHGGVRVSESVCV